MPPRETHMQPHIVYITAKDREEAVTIGKTLVDEQLAACANVLDGATSLYRWQGEVHEDAEAVVFCKTRASLVDTVIARVKDLHSYECPCVVSWPIENGSAEYLAWLKSETEGGASTLDE